MSTPVLLAIVLNMQSVLQQISTSAGYRTDVKTTSVVLDPRPLEMVPVTELPFLILGHDIEPAGRQIMGSRPNSARDVYRVTLVGRVDAPATDTASKLTAVTNFLADIEKALLDDHGHGAGWGFTRGGLAMETLIQQAKFYLGLPEQVQCYIEQPVEVVFRRVYGVA